MGGLQALQAFRRADDANEFDAFCPALFNLRNGVDGTAACGQHRIQHNYFALGNVLGQLAVVFHRLQRLLVAVQANVPHLRGGNQRQHAVHHAKARAQNGHQGQLAAG